ncbi:MAG TPA: hypothetical protein VGE01_02330 [Fimbriimonas sp.]
MKPSPVRALVPTLALAVCLGCGNAEIEPFLGKWNGGFVAEEAAGASKRDNLTGYLQVYRTQDRFELFLQGEQQSVTAKGTWSAEKSRITLTVLDLKVDDGGGEQGRDLSKRFIPADDLKAAYTGKLALDLGPDKLRLKGLKTNVGGLVGVHEFQKVTHKYTY